MSDFALSIEAVGTPVLVFRETHILAVNRAVESLTGWPRSALLDMPPCDLFESMVPLDSALNLYSGDLPQALRLVLRHKDYSLYPVDATLAPLPGEQGCYALTLLTPPPSAGRPQAQSLAERRYRVLSELLTDCAFSYAVGEDGKLMLEWITEEALIRITGYTHAEIEQQRPFYGYYDQDIPLLRTDTERLRAGETFTGEYRMVHKNGSLIWLQLDRMPEFDPMTGRVMRFYGLGRDITARKLAEERLRESELRYRVTTELMSDYAYSFTVTPEGEAIYEWVTQSFERITGYSDYENRTLGTHVLYHPDDIARARADTVRTIAGEATAGDYRILRKDGSLRWLHIERSPERDATTGHVVRFYGIAKDITERMQAEEELRQSEHRYRITTELMSDYAYSYAVAPDNTICYEWTTQSYRRMTGYSESEMQADGVYSLYHPDDQAQVQVDVERVLAGEATSGDYRILHKDGSLRWVHIERMPEWDALQGRVVRFYGIAKDITARKQGEQQQAESERLRIALLKEQELSEIRTKLMRTLSHEFRHPLSIVQTSVDFLDRYLDRLDPARRQERFHIIRSQVALLSEMLDDMSLVVRGLSQEYGMRSSIVDLEAVTQQIVDELSVSTGANHHIDFTFSGALSGVIVIRGLYTRMVTNLLGNAIKYSLPESQIVMRLEASEAEIVVIVADNGIGIAAGDLESVFDPFFRGANIGEIGGTGLGLSIVRDCAVAHGGTIAVTSEIAAGTTFTIRLPVRREL